MLVLGCLLGSLVQTLVIPIQSDLPALMDESREITAWVVTAPIAAACAFTPVAGRLGDMIGRKRVFVALLGLLVIGALASAVAPDAAVLIGGRALQGAAIGLVPLAMSIMKEIVTPARLPLSIAVTSGTMGIGSAFGIPVGALIAELLDWRAMFWFVFVFGLASLMWACWAIPNATSATGGRFDYVGAFGNVIGSGALIAGLALVVSEQGSTTSLTLLGGGVAMLIVTTLHMRRSSAPVIDVRVAFSRRVFLTNAASLLLNFCTMGAMVIYPQLLALPGGAGAGIGLGAIVAGLIIMVNGLAQVLVTPFTVRLSRYFEPRRIATGSILSVAISIGLTLIALDNPWWILSMLVIAGAGFGAAFATLPQVIMASVPVQNVAAANGLNAQIRMFGTAAAAAVIGAVLAIWSSQGAPTTAGFAIAIGSCTAAAVLGVVAAACVPALRMDTIRKV